MGMKRNGSKTPSQISNSAGTEKKRRLARRNTEEAVERLLSDRFRGFSHTQINVVQHEGRTLRQRLLESMREKKRTGEQRPATQTYINSLREMYSADESGSKRLKVKNGTDPVRESLSTALFLAHNPNPAKRTKNALYSFFSVAETLNQKELVGILKSLGEASSLLSATHRGHVLQVMKFLVKVDAMKKFPDECEVMHDMFEDCLTMTFASSRKDQTIENFWQCYADVAQLMCNVNLIEDLLKEKGSWANQRHTLVKVVEGSKLGAKMFGAAAAAVWQEDLSGYFDAEITKFKQTNEPITKANFEKLRERLVAKLSENKRMGKNMVDARRNIKVSYRGATIALQVADNVEEMDMKLGAFVKEFAVGQAGGITPLQFELACFGKPVVREGALHNDILILRDFQSARAAANEAFTMAGAKSGSEMSDVLFARASVLRQLDRTFDIESGSLKVMLESEGQRKLEENVLATLPSKDVTRTIDNVISDVVQIQSSALYNFVQPSVRGVIDGARELLQTLERGEQVQVAQIPAKGFMRNVLEACAFFAKFEVPAGVDDVATTLYGKSALKEILKSLRLQLVDGTLTMEKLQVPTMLAHLLTDEDRTLVEHLTDETIKLVMGVQKGAADEDADAKGKAIRKAKGTPRATTTITKESKKKNGEQAVHNMVSSWFA